uniref:Uncharacterized protein n=1 Tax=Strongyloides stercoralis TaxID=6248 RepID=A0A0K0ENI6_STRER
MHWYNKFIINLEEITMKHFNYKLMSFMDINRNLEQEVLCFYDIIEIINAEFMFLQNTDLTLIAYNFGFHMNIIPSLKLLCECQNQGFSKIISCF